MMGKGTRWNEIYEDLKDQIISGSLEPGSPIPTNLELSSKYRAHTGTIQTAIKALIQDGLIIATGRKSPRLVRTIPKRSKRASGFSSDQGSKARKNVLALEMLQGEDIPHEIRDDLKSSTALLFYHNEQFVDDNLLAVSRSYIPDFVNLDELYSLLQQPGASLYASLEKLGSKPTTCHESLVADIASKQEKEELHLPAGSNIPVCRLVRKVYDQHDQLVELCFLLCRADHYEFDYKFKL
jgi:GntR family transcriptional regulator